MIIFIPQHCPSGHTAEREYNYSNNFSSGVFTCKKYGYVIATTFLDSTISGWDYTRTNLIKVDNNGVVKWDKKYRSASYGQNTAITYELSNGDIITCGQVGHFNNPPVGGNYWGIYGFIMKTDSMGNVLFYHTYEASPYQAAYNYLRDIKQTADGGYVACGFVQPNDGVTTQDVWVLKVDSMGCEVFNCNIGINELVGDNNEGFSLFPNPSIDFFTIETKQEMNGKLELYDMFGLQYKCILVNGTPTLNVSTAELSNGIYIVKYRDNSGAIVYSQKIIVQH